MLYLGSTGGTQTFATYTYSTKSRPLSKLTFGNSQYINYTYDELERLSKVQYNGGTDGYTYAYNGSGDLYSVSARNLRRALTQTGNYAKNMPGQWKIVIDLYTR